LIGAVAGGAGTRPGKYRCNLSAALDHPNVEVAQYNFDLRYPGPAESGP
jgi:hypothetical protein